MDTAPFVPSPPLDTNAHVDVAVLGAGITGITAAYLLKAAGLRVAVLDIHDVGLGETGHTTAHLTALVDAGYHAIIKKFGKEAAKLVAASQMQAIETIGRISRDEGIACAFERLSAFIYSEDKQGLRTLEQEFESLQALGVEVTWTKEVALPMPIQGAVRIANQAQFHPLIYVQALARRIAGQGSYVFGNTRATSIEEGDPCHVHTNAGSLLAKHIIVATNTPVTNLFALHTKVAAYRTYAMAFESSEAPPPGLYWDTDQPYHYTRMHAHSGKTYVIVGGADHKTGQKRDTKESFDALKAYIQARYGTVALAYAWSGQVLEPVDGLPFIGRNTGNERVWVATGYSGTGMTFGTVAALLIRDQILGVNNPWGAIYDPRRIKPLAQLGRFVAENVDYPTLMLKDRLATEGSLEDIPPNQGMLVGIGGKVLAVFRDLAGRCHALTPVCPHMGCYVHWNDAEKTWDCPCHGSRFDCRGKVLNGPATQDLRRCDEPRVVSILNSSGQSGENLAAPPPPGIVNSPF